MSDTDCCADGEWDRTLGAADDTTLNQAFGLLSDRRRRYVLEELYTSEETVRAVADLVDDVLARDTRAPERERVLVALYHKTLPRLADGVVVDFDPRTNTVRYRGGELIDDLLSVLVEDGDAGCPV